MNEKPDPKPMTEQEIHLEMEKALRGLFRFSLTPQARCTIKDWLKASEQQRKKLDREGEGR